MPPNALTQPQINDNLAEETFRQRIGERLRLLADASAAAAPPAPTANEAGSALSIDIREVLASLDRDLSLAPLGLEAKVSRPTVVATLFRVPCAPGGTQSRACAASSPPYEYE